MKINISDMMDNWQGPVPDLADRPVEDMDALRARTLEKVRAAGGQKRPRRVSRVLVIAAVLAACVVGVSAATGQLPALLSLPWQNDTIVSTVDEARADASQNTETNSGREETSMGFTSPNGTPPCSLEETLESRRSKAMNWSSWESARGSFGPSIDQWTDLEVTDATGPVKRRTVHGLDHKSLFPQRYVKYEYTAPTPAELATVTSGLVVLDTAWLSAHYQAPEWANFYYQIYDSRNALRGEVCDILYITEDGRYVDITYEYAPGINLSPSYRVESNYDRVETYSSATGVEAVIATKTGNLWAEATTPEFVLSLYGGYLTVEEAESILDHISVSRETAP